MTRRAALLLLWLVGSCAASPATQALDGSGHRPLQPATGRVHVLVFTSQECPIANSYAPTLQALAARWRDRPVDLFVVHVDPQLTVAAAMAHAAEYGLPGVVLRDTEQRLAHALGVTRTPEAAVVTAAGLLYRGRIDDRWQALGLARAEPSQHDLADAVARALAGSSSVQLGPPAVGCLLPEPTHP